MRLLTFARFCALPLLCLIAGQSAATVAEPGGLQQHKRHGQTSIRLELDKTSIGIAERLRYTLIVQCSDRLTADFEGVGERLGSFEVIERNPAGPLNLPDGRLQWQREYVLGATAAGQAIIPALNINFLSARGECLSASDCELSAHGRRSARGSRAREQFHLQTDPVAIQVSTVLPDDADTTRPRDVLKPLALDRPAGATSGTHWQWQAAAGLGALFIAILGWLGYRRADLAPVGPGRVAASAQQLALNRLNALRRAGLLQQGQTSELLFQLSRILRQFLSEQFGLPALILTTRELGQIAMSDHPMGRAGLEITGLLEAIDQSRFAHQYPDDADCQELISRAEAVVRSVPGEPRA